MWQALLNLAKQGKFRGRTVPCFFGSSETDYGHPPQGRDGQYGVYDLMPNAKDQFGIWENNPAARGPGLLHHRRRQVGHRRAPRPGRRAVLPLVLPLAGPEPGQGRRLAGLHDGRGADPQAPGDRVVWMRPSDITDRYHKAGGWGFLDEM